MELNLSSKTNMISQKTLNTILGPYDNFKTSKMGQTRVLNWWIELIICLYLEDRRDCYYATTSL